MTSKLDAVYRSFLITKFFTKGWGKPENLRRLFEFRKIVANRDECFKLIERDYPVTITKDQKLSDCHIVEGYFDTPLERYLPGIVPKIAQQAHFQAIFPLHWPRPDYKPVCLHLAGTGDHFFWRRRNLMVKPLIKEAGIGGIILENPFYGLRKPIDQVRSSLHNVSDIFVMGGCLILESLVLFHWCERNGFGPLGVTGLSMGGHMASLAATNWPKPLVLVPCLSWSTASAVFLQGVMAHSINWDLLEDQYLADVEYREKLAKMVTVVDEAFLAGKKFARTFSDPIEEQSQMTDTNNQDLTNPKEITNEQIPTTNPSEIFKENQSMHGNLQLNQSAYENVPTDQNQSVIDSTFHKSQNISENRKYGPSQTDKTELKKGLTRKELDLQIDKFIRTRNAEVKQLLDSNKISQSLYEKLTSNEKFELDLEDIEYLIKCKVVTNNESQPQSPQEQLTVSPKEMIFAEIPNNTETEKSPQIVMQAQTESQIIEKPRRREVDRDKYKPNETWNASITPDWLTSFPFSKSKSGKKIDISKIHWRDRETLQFMRGIMDECTHLSNFTVPYDTSLIIAVCAKHDAYVPRDDTGRLEEIWPGAEVRYVDAGHVSAYILHQSLFRSCIVEAFERSKKKWKEGKHVD